MDHCHDKYRLCGRLLLQRRQHPAMSSFGESMACRNHANIWKAFPENWRGITGMGFEEVSVSTFPTDRKLWRGVEYLVAQL